MSCLYSKYLCYRPLYQLDNTIDFTTYISRINHYFCGGDEISGLTQKKPSRKFLWTLKRIWKKHWSQINLLHLPNLGRTIGYVRLSYLVGQGN